ncbi:MAG: response regulator transcription factor [Candidatus Omnitrophota bacterium]
MKKILIIEDDPVILLGLKDELSSEYEIKEAGNGSLGIEIALKEKPDLIILDILLPDISGLLVCQEIRTSGIDSAIIMLTALSQINDKVKGLEAGADDYLTKPFSLPELKARLKALLRRSAELASVEKYKDSSLDIDFKKYTASRNKKSLKLSVLEFNLLRFLILRKGDVVSRQELLQRVWGYHNNPFTRTVDVYVLSLRKKIGKEYLKTVHGLGYRFIPKIPKLPTSPQY